MMLFKPAKLVLAMGLTLSAGTLLTGCNLVETDSENFNTTANYDNVLTYVSGKIIDAATQMPIGNAVVKIKVDGRWLQTTSINSEDHTKGDFKIDGLPKQSFTYDMIIEAPADANYAPAYFSSDATELEVSNSESNDPEISLNNISILHGTSGRGDMGLLKLIPAVTTSVTVLDTVGAAIEGLQLHWDILEESENSGQIDIQADSVSAGVYSFNIPKGHTISVDVAEAVDAAGNRYQLLSGDDFSAINANLTKLTAGEDEVIVLRKKSSRDVTINFYMFNEQGEAITDLGKGLQVTDTVNDSKYALQEVIPGTDAVAATVDTEAVEATPETPTNKYSFVAQKKRAYTWVLPAIDADADGLEDFATKVLTGDINNEGPQPKVMALSEDNEGLELDINEEAYLTETKDAEGNISYSISYNVVLTDIEAYEEISSEVLSKRFIANSQGELKIAFNRPVRLLGDKPVWATHTGFETSTFEERIEVNGSAEVLNANSEEIDETVDLDDDQRYSYNDAEGSTSVAVGGIDDDKTVNNTWSTNFSEVVTDIEVNVELSNNDTVMTITVADPTELNNLDQYTLHYAVEGLSDQTVWHDSETVSVNSGSAYTLDDLVVDFADGYNNEGRTVFDSLVSDIVNNNQPLHINLPNYNGSAELHKAEAITAEDFEEHASNYGDQLDLNNGLNLVLPTNVSGSIKVIGYVETHANESNEADTTTETTLLGYDVIEIADMDYNESLAQPFYSYSLPRNEYVTNVPEMDEDDNGMDMQFGFNLAEGWYYKVAISGVSPEEPNGYISSVTLDFDVEYGTDKHIKGIKTFTVR